RSPASRLFPYTTLFRSQSAKLVDLTAQLLDISRIEAGKLRLDYRDTDVTALVRLAVDAGQASTQAHTLTFIAPRPCRGMVDALRSEEHTSELQSHLNLV